MPESDDSDKRPWIAPNRGGKVGCPVRSLRFQQIAQEISKGC